MEFYSPLQEISHPFPGDVRVFMKRDDLLHPEIQGNKWRKLSPVIQRLNTEIQGILSFGGPFSNHLHALAAAGIKCQYITFGIHLVQASHGGSDYNGVIGYHYGR